MYRFACNRVAPVYYANGMAHTTSGFSLFEIAANAIHWSEVQCQSFGTARQIPDDEILTVSLVAGGEYRVRAGRVREWMRQAPSAKNSCRLGIDRNSCAAIIRL